MRNGLIGAVVAVLFLGPLWLTAPAADDAAPAADIPQFEAEYELRRNNTRAALLMRSLRCDGGECRFQSEGRTVGLVDLVLRGRITEWTSFSLQDDGTLRPREYYYRQQARGGNNEYARLFFNPDSGRVSSRGDLRWDQDVEGEAMDELLSQLRLMLAVRAGETSMEFSVVDSDGELDSYEFAVVGEESVSTPAGTFQAVKVERRGGSRRRVTTMWFAPELEYMPIVVRQERVGRETFTATLQELHRAP
ncbi:hypothetical protein J2T57_002332 [Natronocella acetinitrilica]|uniref:DUF3108 domain-containing protein n=1 Tax=Natronocella acetinitrilica TaxID=414046 RepID=A0AAE3KBZ6_9GAMM|nr:DUF3108 domain-containing protein [Natronocella acetinitrilica]MCP1675184.1 hypothetical protein [Natronocella acetinitrilica]